MKIRMPLSTLCLSVLVVGLFLAVFLLTARHNAQLIEQAERHNLQLREQADSHNAQMAEMTAIYNRLMLDQAGEFQKQLDRAAAQPPGTAAGR